MKARTNRERKIIDRVTRIRARNNGCWMAILELALLAAPKEARLILKEINKNDRAVTKWLGRV